MSFQTLLAVDVHNLAFFIAQLFLLITLSMLWRYFLLIIWTPFHLTNFFRKQGVKGPANTLLYGSIREIQTMKKISNEDLMDVDSHDTPQRILPHLLKWFSQYGDTFFFLIGTKPYVCIKNAEYIKNVLSNTYHYTKPTPSPYLLSLLGNGILFAEKAQWAHHRKVVTQAFTTDNLKLMTKKMNECALTMVRTWQDKLQEPIEINEEFKKLTTNIINYTAFGTNYVQGKQVFDAQRELQLLASENILSLDIPGYTYLPTKTNLKRWALERTLHKTLMLIIQARLKRSSNNTDNDLLGFMIDGYRTAPHGKSIDIDKIIADCKTFFFAGHETTALLLTWTMFLLARNQDWQQNLREEAFRECGDANVPPNAITIHKLKMMKMVLLETLRLYGPVNALVRKASTNTMLGDVSIPKDTIILLPLLLIHKDRQIWGADADHFNPLRFQNGVSKAAQHPSAFMPFSVGPRVCLGEKFAIMEAKVAMATILRRFSFSLSPHYKHAPYEYITLKPEHGVPILLKSL